MAETPFNIEETLQELDRAIGAEATGRGSYEESAQLRAEIMAEFGEQTARIAELEKQLADLRGDRDTLAKCLRYWNQYDDADPQVKGECLREAREQMREAIDPMNRAGVVDE